jgi:DNA-binding SARP family transcriptional activator
MAVAELANQWVGAGRDGIASQHQRSPVVERKLTISDTPLATTPRERVDGLLRELVEANPVVAVTATAGAGKSVAVAHASRTFARSLAWLSVEATDAAPGRLVIYLEEALARQVPSARGVATQALAAGIPHAEAVALLVEATAGAEVVLVLDDLERLHGSSQAWEVVSSIVRYAPSSMRLLLISRRALPAVVCFAAPGGHVAQVVDADLAFTVEEARIALERLGRSGSDAADAVAATGGWVIGVLFDAWRCDGNPRRTLGGADDLGGYLGAQILGELGAADSEFLVTTSVLQEVTVESAVALGIDAAAERLASLRGAHIPAQWSSDPSAMRCHPRFREYLRELLDHRGYTAVRELRRAYGRLLAHNGFHEEAVEELLAAGALIDAFASARRSMIGVVARLDFAVADRWMEALTPVAAIDDAAFAEAQLMQALARDDFRHGARIADELAAVGRREQLAATSERTAALMGWCYGAAGRLDEAHAVLDSAPDGPDVKISRYAVAVWSDRRQPPVRPDPTGGPLDGLLYGVDYLHGRLGELADQPPSPWTALAMRTGRIGALRATGRTAEALQQYQAERRGCFFGTLLESSIGPCVLLDAQRIDDARAELARGRERVAASGSPLLTGLHHTAAAKVALRADRDTAGATQILAEIEKDPAAMEYPVVCELAQTWGGLAALHEEDNAGALSSLRAAVAGMHASGRILELPSAAVYLAEAEWRAGNHDAADIAADIALEAARRHGSNHVLLQALADFPAVVARRIDVEPHADSVWHSIGRALAAQCVVVGTHIPTAIELVEFGRQAIIINGQEAPRPRIGKCYELLSFLAARGEASVSRDELLNGLFDARDDESARSYLRQMVVGLRHLLGADSVTCEDGRVGLSPDVVVASESDRLQRELAAAIRLQGIELVAAIEQALAPLARGEYLAGARSAWVDERRQQLAECATTARAAAADAAYAADRYHDARRLAEAVLAAEPLREAMWRTLMRISSAVGDYDGVISTFGQCKRALNAAGIHPTASTRALLEQLRR